MYARRKFLEFVAASPLAAMQQTGASDLISDPKQAINVLDFEAAARKALPPAHFGYMATGVDGDRTLQANREAYDHYYLRPRRLTNIIEASMRTRLFGKDWDMPIGLAPVGNMGAFHTQGELPVARAAKAKRTLAILSTTTNTSVEDFTKANGEAPWYQLYPTSRWEYTERLIKRAEQAGCPVVALTVDTIAGRHTETFERMKKLDKRDCSACHGTTPEEFYSRKPMYQGFELAGLKTNNPTLTWEHVRKLKAMTSMKLLIKGIETREDAAQCVECGVDGIIVSNHGGRAEESGRGTIDCLPEVVEAAGGRVPVMLDGGIRRGTDVFKALALGASAVFIGRPYIWGLSAFGQPGVERVIDILKTELSLVMRQCGCRSIAEIGPRMVGRV